MESGLWEGPVETNQQDDMEKQRKETIETHKVDFFRPFNFKNMLGSVSSDMYVHFFLYIIETN